MSDYKSINDYHLLTHDQLMRENERQRDLIAKLEVNNIDLTNKIIKLENEKTDLVKRHIELEDSNADFIHRLRSIGNKIEFLEKHNWKLSK